MALAADTNSIDFHISPLLKTGGLSAQIRQSLNDLIRNTHGETIVKLRAFVAGSGDARRVQAQVTELFSEHRLPLPALSILQVGGLGEGRAQVVIEAVVATHRDVNPNGLVFFFGKRERSLDKALAQLKTDTELAHIPSEALLTCTCFASSIESYSEATEAFHRNYSKGELNLVQAVRDPQNSSARCEAVGQAFAGPEAGANKILVLENAHATLVRSSQLIFTGLQLSFGNYLADAEEAFTRLTRAASALGTSERPVQVDGFALDASSGAALRKRISLSPSTFTIQEIEGLPSVDALAGIEAVLAPNVQSAAVPVPEKANGTISPE